MSYVEKSVEFDIYLDKVDKMIQAERKKGIKDISKMDLMKFIQQQILNT